MRLSILLVLAFFVLNLATASDPSEYINEFNNANETCEIIDFFYYQIEYPFLWITQHKNTMPVIYGCCENDSCVSVIYDVYNNEFLNEINTKEIIDLNYVRYMISQEGLSSYTLNLSSLSICNPFGSDKLNQELINLGSQTAEWILKMKKTKDAKKALDVINLAKTVNLIDDFNPAGLAFSVACFF